ncbi:hypothetical protein Tsubulata_019734 [Turnera subulata]|uniref:Nodulin-like domain-containing protein n=1 Tax=Turnera subulata TaxID=218843 RepID=A0A9Q0JDR0_9ROSI|nr:hypothetical protein Tsubulata_019734 [Turnera subulata]
MSSKSLQWLTLVGMIWLQAVNGTNNNFPAYSSQLKHLLSISQLKLNNLAFASDAGKLFGFFSGIAALYLPLWLVLLIGSFLGFAGYGLQYLFVSSQISSLSYTHFFLLSVVAGNGICWINTVCYIASIRNFPFDRQVAVGLTTSYQGLSAEIYTVLVGALFSNSKAAKDYLLLNAVLPLAVCVVTSPLVGGDNVRHGKSLRVGFVVMFIITIATGFYAVITSFGRLSSLGSLVGITVFLLVPLVVPLAAKIREVMFLKKEMKIHNFNTVEEKGNGGGDGDVEAMEKDSVSVSDTEEVGHEQVVVDVKEEIGVKLMLRRLNFWLYFFVYFSGATIGLVYLNNLGQIAESRGFSGTSSLVSLASSFCFFGRLLPSLLDYFFSRSRYMISRPASIAALMGPIAGAFFLLLNTTHICLYISTAVIGICTGAITSISVSTTTELFGMKNFGVNHNVVVANIPIGSFVYGYMAALIYRKQGGGGDAKCMGSLCYRTTFIIWGSISSLGTLAALILYSRLRKFYTSQRS